MLCLTSYNSSNHRLAFSQRVCKGERHNYLAEEPTTQSPAACPRSLSSAAERSKSSCHAVKEKLTLSSSFSLLYLVLLRQKFSTSASDRKNIFLKASESMLWLCGSNPGICVFLSKNHILTQSGFCRHSAPLWDLLIPPLAAIANNCMEECYLESVWYTPVF